MQPSPIERIEKLERDHAAVAEDHGQRLAALEFDSGKDTLPIAGTQGGGTEGEIKEG